MRLNMASLLEYKCPNCGGHIVFDTASQKFKCEFCDSVFTEEQLASQQNAAEQKAQNEASPDIPAEEAAQYGWAPTNEGETLGEMSVYSCQSCGAKVTTDVNTVASKCPYCDSPIIMTGKVTGLLKPACIIPFKLDKKQAGEELKKFCKGKWFLPSKFVSENRIQDMKGVYVPFWLFDTDVSANIVYEATRVRTWSDSDYNYTETSFFNVFRNGDIGFADIPVDASEKMPDDYMDGIEPFDYKDMSDFNPAFLAGFMADKYDVSAEQSFPRAETRVKNSTQSEFAKTVNGFTGVVPVSTNITPKNSRYRYAMLPVWMMNTKFAGKNYLFAVNGQTGRVAGSLPIDKKKLFGMFGGIVAAIMAVAQFFILR